MNRDYVNGTKEDAIFFFGKEVEYTPAYGMDTLFIVGIQPIELIEQKLSITTYKTNHIFFGANHSFNPQNFKEHKQWEDMIFHFLDKEYLCSLDIPINQIEDFHESGYCEYDNFIPQIRIPIPYIRLWNYNTTLKIDDRDFKSTNPGVWSHSLHKLMSRDNFTPWNKYKGDTIL